MHDLKIPGNCVKPYPEHLFAEYDGSISGVTTQLHSVCLRCGKIRKQTIKEGKNDLLVVEKYGIDLALLKFAESRGLIPYQ